MFQPVILRLALRYIRRRILQSLLFILGVALGVALVIAIDLANNSASRAFALSTESVTGKATHQITAGSQGLPTSVYTGLRRTLGLRAEERSLELEAVLGADALFLTNSLRLVAPVSAVGAARFASADHPGLGRLAAALRARMARSCGVPEAAVG